MNGIKTTRIPKIFPNQEPKKTLSTSVLLCIWDYCDNETLLTKLNKLSSSARKSILGFGAGQLGLKTQRTVEIDLQRFINSTYKISFGYYAQYLIGHVTFKFTIEPSVRKVDNPYRLEEEQILRGGKSK